MDGTPCTIREEPDRHGVYMALRIVDRDGNDIASCFYSEGNTPPFEVVEKTATFILRAINMHDRLVATLATIHETAGHVSDAVNALALIKLLTIGPLFDEARGDK